MGLDYLPQALAVLIVFVNWRADRHRADQGRGPRTRRSPGSRPGRDPVTAGQPTRTALLDDDDCAFCKWSLDKILDLGPAQASLRPIPIQSDEGQGLLAAWGVAESDASRAPGTWCCRPARSTRPAPRRQTCSRPLRGGKPLAWLFRDLSRDHRPRLPARRRQPRPCLASARHRCDLPGPAFGIVPVTIDELCAAKSDDAFIDTPISRYRDALSAATQIAAGLPGGQPGKGSMVSIWMNPRPSQNALVAT